MRLRQIVLAAGDLCSTRTRIEDELGLPHVWADPGVGHFGLRNALYAIGDSFLEVVSPTTDDAPARRFLDRSGGDAGYMAIVQTTGSLEDVRRRAADEGVRVVFTAEGEGVVGLHLHPSDTGGTLLSIDRCDAAASWPWAGPAWEAAPDRGARGIAGATFAVTDPRAVAARWGRLLDVPAQADRIELGATSLFFVSNADGRRGLCEVVLDGLPRPSTVIAGVRFSFTSREWGDRTD